MKVLAVDDDKVSLFVLSTMLKKLDYTVLEAADGREAWELFLSHQPPLVITDWQMPYCDGLELSRKIREYGGTEGTGIILLTALSEQENADKMKTVGIDRYLTKPFDLSALNACIHSLALLRYNHRDQ